MQLLSFEESGRAHLGVRRGDAIVDLAEAAPGLPDTWPEVFTALLLSEVAKAAEGATDSALRSPEEITLLPPIPRPPKVLAIGLNYHAHAAEVGLAAPEHPIVFARYPLSFVGHDVPLLCPSASEQFDYEGELVVVIGKGGRHIPAERALGHLAGYSVGNDGSLRDFQFQTTQWTLGKNFDASGSWGPHIATVDEVPGAGDGLAITTRLNGEVVQAGNSSDLIFAVPALIAALSEVMTLEPGDIILTGTPPGVGASRKPPLWMKPGDSVQVEIEGIGCLSNPVQAAV